jgi:hypothetical protein
MKRISFVSVLVLGLCLGGAWAQLDIGHRGRNLNQPNDGTTM